MMYLEVSNRVQGKPLQDLGPFLCIASSSLVLQQSPVTLASLNSVFLIPWVHLVLLEMTLPTPQSRRFLHTKSQDIIRLSSDNTVLNYLLFQNSYSICFVQVSSCLLSVGEVHLLPFIPSWPEA